MLDKKLISESIDLEGVGEVVVNWDFDEDDYREWLQENGYDNDQNSWLEYVNDNVTFELEYADNDTFHHCGYYNASFYEMVDAFGEGIANRVLEELKENGESRFETQEIYNSQQFDVNNPDELNRVAMQILNHGGYYKDCRGYILTNGVVVYTPAEHNMVSIIDGIKGTYDFIHRGNIRVLPQSIDLGQEPTEAQREVLRKVVASYAREGLYMDIMGDMGNFSARYDDPYYNQVMGDIDRYFKEGIKPQGDMYENRSTKKSLIKESSDIEFTGYPDNMTLMIDGNKVCTYSFNDSKAYPFIIFNGQVYVGDNYHTHNQFVWSIPGTQRTQLPIVKGRIWVSAKVNEFNYSVVSFWGADTDEDLKPYVYQVAKKVKVNPAKIVVVAKIGQFGNNEISKPVPLSQWDGTIHQLTSNEAYQQNLHMMDSGEKHDRTGGFRQTRDAMIGRKLTNDKGEEMPMAKYRSMIQQEQKQHTNLIITESQYNRLFLQKK